MKTYKRNINGIIIEDERRPRQSSRPDSTCYRQSCKHPEDGDEDNHFDSLGVAMRWYQAHDEIEAVRSNNVCKNS